MPGHLTRNRKMVDPLVALAFFTTCALAEAGRHQFATGGGMLTAAWWTLLLATAVALGVSGRRPLVALTLMGGVLVTQLIFPSCLFPVWFYLGMAYIVFRVAATLRSRLLVVSSAAATVLAAILIAGLQSSYSTINSDWPLVAVAAPGEIQADAGTVLANRIALFTLVALVGAVSWTAGFALNGWEGRRRAEGERAEVANRLLVAETDLVVAEERERIAHEVHDVMAHSLAVIVAQADGARYVAEQRPEAVGQSLEAISEAARDSLSDVRRLIENLVSGSAPATVPGLAAIDELIDRMRTAGLDVHIRRFGDSSRLSPAQEFAAHRIVQESLTNALRHSGGNARARVSLDARGPGLVVTVASSGDGDARPGPDGHGITGMRERARLSGGWLEAGRDDEDGEFLVTAFIPGGGRPEAAS